MATAPNSMQSAPTGADTDSDTYAGGGDGGSDDAGSGSYCIEIHVKPGGITVNVEPEAEEAQEEGASDAGGGDTDSDSGTPAKNIKDALTQALEIYRNGGEMPQAADDSFQKGFAGGQS